MKVNKTLSQIWRFIRLYGFSFGAVLVTVTQATAFKAALGQKVQLAAVIAAVVPALEVAYRKVVPAREQSKLLAMISAAKKAYTSVTNAPATNPVEEILTGFEVVATPPPPSPDPNAPVITAHIPEAIKEAVKAAEAQIAEENLGPVQRPIAAFIPTVLPPVAPSDLTP